MNDRELGLTLVGIGILFMLGGFAGAMKALFGKSTEQRAKDMGVEVQTLVTPGIGVPILAIILALLKQGAWGVLMALGFVLFLIGMTLLGFNINDTTPEDAPATDTAPTTTTP